MKIVCIDNFDRDCIPEHPHGEEFFVVRTDDAKVGTIESIT